MLRLLVGNVEVELYGDVPVNLTKQFTDVSEINKSQGSYSQTFRIPLTRQNQQVFEPSSDPTIVTTYNTKEKQPAVLMDDTLPLLNGFIQIKSWYLSNGQNGEVEVVFFGEVTDLSKKIGDSKLADLNLSSYDLTMTVLNILNGWSTDDPVKFGVVDRGQNWAGPGILQTTNDIAAYEMSGYIRVSTLLTEIFDAAGLTYESTWLSGQNDLHLLAVAGGLENKFVSADATAGFHVGLPSSSTFSATGGPVVMPFVDSGDFSDAGNNFASGTGVYTSPITANMRFQVKAKFLSKAAGQTLIRLYRNGSLVDTLLTISGTTTGTQFVGDSVTFTVNAGDTIDLRASVVGSGTSILLGTGTTTSPTTSFQVTEIFQIGSIWSASRNLPDMKQMDFVYGLQRMFNLVFIPDPLQPSHFVVEPLSEYVATGVERDWSQFIDRTKDWSIKPTADLQKRQYEWNLATGEDVTSQLVLKTLDRTYGRWRVTDPDNDFASGTMSVQSPFASLLPQIISGTDFVVPVLVNEAREPLSNPKPRLAYWNGLNNDNWTLGGAAITGFPEWTDVSDPIGSIDVDTLDLNYGYERRFFDIVANPRESLYYKYWHPFTASLYSEEARIMEATFQLPSAEVLAFDWADRIWVNNDYWRVLAIDYDANDVKPLCRVKLLKIVASTRLCEYLPHSIAKTGQVSFTNSFGTVLTTVPRGCCELFGHVYDTATATCYGATRQ